MKIITCFIFLSFQQICLGQILNSSFENWTFNQNASQNAQKWVLNDWLHCNNLGEPLDVNGLSGTYKDSLAQSGDYALTLSRWYDYTFDMAKFNNKCLVKPVSLQGFYKYTDSPLSTGILDTALISIYFTKTSANGQVTETIGSGKTELAATNNFLEFDCPIVYTQEDLTPDSVIIVVQPSKFTFGVGGCPGTGWCSFLTIDELAFNFSTGTTEAIDNQAFIVFPNPSSTAMTIQGKIQNKTMQLRNSLGQVIWDRVANSDQETVETYSLSKGLYFLSINGKTEKIMVE